MKIFDKVAEVAESMDWSVSYDFETHCAEFNKETPAGEDFSFSVDTRGIIKNVREYANDFDPEEHAMMMYNAGRNGFAGVPRLKVLVKDADDIDEMLEELASDLEDIDEYDGEEDNDGIDKAIKYFKDEIRNCRMAPKINGCEMQEDWQKTIDACEMAIAALREKKERENLKPLTLEDLRQMDGEPVWIEANYGMKAWALVYASYYGGDLHCIDNGAVRWEECLYGDTNAIDGWLAYRSSRRRMVE